MSDIERHSANLTANQQRAIFCLLTEANIRDAAKAAKLSEATLFRWLNDEAFNKAYLEARRQATKQAIAQLQQAGSDAVETLRDVMQNATATPAARVSAAKAVLEMSIRAVELEDLSQRVDELERRIELQNALKGKQ